MDAARPLAGRYATRLEWWDDGRLPADGPPDRVEESVIYHEADGTIVTDAARIAAIEAGIPSTEQEDQDGQAGE